MKCPVCIKQDLKSKLYGGDSCFITAMSGGEFYDEGGVSHRHDPNTSSYGYRCSNGHSFIIKRRIGCCDEWPAIEEIIVKA